jgi:hypothetical protein
MTNSIGPLDWLRQFPIQSLIAVAFLTLFCAWWVALWRQKRRATAMQLQLDELRRNVRRLEADYWSLVARFLNLSGSAKSLTVPNDRKGPSIVPEKSEIALSENGDGETAATVKPEIDTRAGMV